jgi:hypothetical protein
MDSRGCGTGAPVSITGGRSIKKSGQPKGIAGKMAHLEYILKEVKCVMN